MSHQDKHWKKDFPINRSQANQVSRRDFAKLLAVVSGGMVVGNGVIAAKAAFFNEPKNEKKQKICAKNEIPVGGTKSFVLENDTVPYILIHTEEGEFYAYEQKCTHLSCAVYYKPGTLTIECPCHNGWFDVKTGNVIQGPPPRPLKKLDVTFEGNAIYVQHPKNETV
ncbi:Rieske (2Fe-2S) protein [Flavobacterium supellecticarium]|uniref:Rieske (2Fe-2S) protein n=1 Tax=Flavobacterium supellecticarium TaxID=2565924 RepID=A0A4S3ZQT6_9FLAO|nr:Rieske (2Fe-2S) protein [Flavobacterium supellecticarium]THF47949.1 Rieske (2Fe-2S) protein [Flavobacterium supellecticarium]